MHARPQGERVQGRAAMLWMLAISAIVLASPMTGCASADIALDTQVGLRTGEEIGGPLQVLGVARMTSWTGNLANAHGIYTEDVDFYVPVGTQVILPSIETLALGYGSDLNDDIGVIQPEWNVDRYFGVELVQLEVQDINAPDLSTDPPTQYATIRISFQLRDKNGDDPYFGQVVYNLLYLGREEEPNPNTFRLLNWNKTHPKAVRRSIKLPPHLKE